jgi:hypothetical protein
MKKDWLDPNTWFNKNTTSEIEYKKATICALYYIYNAKPGTSISENNHFPLESLLKDIDIVAFMFKHYLLDKNILSTDQIQEHLQDREKAYYILKHGMPGFVTEHILSLYPYFSTDIEVVKAVIEDTPNLTHLFSEYVSKRRNLDKLLEKNIIHEIFLKYYPHDYTLSKKLIEKGVHPYGVYQELYNKDLLNDKKFILKYLPKRNGNYLYRALSERLQFDKDICQLMTIHYPYEETKQLYINNMDEFLVSLDGESPFSTEISIVFGNIRKLPFITDNMDNLITAFKAIVEKKCDSYIDLMAGPVFSEHPLQEFLTNISSTNKIVHKFINSDVGKKYINFPINNYETYIEYEQTIMPKIGEELSIFYTQVTLEKSLKKKNKTIKINKV